MAQKGQDGDSAVLIKRLIAGAGSGAITKTSIAPIERVQILHQVQGMKARLTNNPTAAIRYHGFGQTMGLVIKEEGFLALYKGNFANVLRCIPTYAFKFAFNESYRDLVRRHRYGSTVPGVPKNLTFFDMFVAGSLAGWTQISITYPLEVVRSRLALAASMSGGKKYSGVFDCARTILKEEGIRGLYKGLLPSYLSGIPFIATQMTMYSIFQKLVPKNEDGEAHVLGKLAAGAGAGVCAQTLGFPGDTLRKRMQNDGIGGAKKQYKGMIDAIKQIIRKEGIRAFYDGLRANVIGAIPGAAIQFVTFDLLKKQLGL